MGKKKEEKKLEKARRKEEKARRKEEKRLRREQEEAARLAAEQESELEAREKSLLRHASKPAVAKAAAKRRIAPRRTPHPDPSPLRGEGQFASAPHPDGPADAPEPTRPKRKRRAAKPEGRAAKPGRRAAKAEREPEPERESERESEPGTESEPESEPEPEPETETEPETESEVRAASGQRNAEPPLPPARPRRPKKRKSRARPRIAARPEPPINEPELEDEENAQEEVEAQLDRLLRRSMTPAAAERARELLGNGERLAGRLSQEGPEPRSASVLDSARELLSSDYYLRVWGQLGMRGRSVEIDEYGLDPKVEAKWQPFFDFLYRTYWRVQVRGIENVPDEGRCLLVANHSGTIPYDGAMIKTAVLREHPARRSVRWLAEDFVFHFPFLGAFMNRIGAVRACQENADRLLRQERLVAVFPEGIKGIGKLYKQRYRLQRFGRGGYVKLVLRTGAPIVPVAVVGAEEIHPLLLRGRFLANLIGMPYLPVTPTFPWLGPLGLVPLPSQWTIEFGEPISFDGYGPEAAEDPVLVNRLNDEVRARIQQMLDGLLATRTGAA